MSKEKIEKIRQAYDKWIGEKPTQEEETFTDYCSVPIAGIGFIGGWNTRDKEVKAEEEKKSKHFNEKHKNTVELSEDAQSALQKAIAEYKKNMLDLYPVGTHWMCTHGTRGKYEVEIKGFNFIRGGFVAENTKTHKTKIVHWTALRSGA